MAVADCNDLDDSIYAALRSYAAAGFKDINSVIEDMHDKGIASFSRDMAVASLAKRFSMDESVKDRAITSEAGNLAKIVSEARLERRVEAEVKRYINDIEQMASTGKLPSREAATRASAKAEAVQVLHDRLRTMRESIRSIEMAQQKSEWEKRFLAGEDLDDLAFEIENTKRKDPNTYVSPALESVFQARKQAMDMFNKDSKLMAALASAKRVRSLQSQISTLENHIREGTLPTMKSMKKAAGDEAALIKKKQTLRDALKNSPAGVKKRVEDALARYEQKLRDKTPEVRPRTSTIEKAFEIDKELGFRLQSAKNAVDKKIRDAQKRTMWQALSQKSMAFKALKASFDAPPLFRQGLFTTLSRPTIAAKAFMQGAKSTYHGKDSKFYRDSMQALRSRDNSAFYVRDNLEINDLDDMSSFKVDEIGGADVWSKFPVLGKTISGTLGRFDAGFTTFLNTLRADSYDAFARAYTKTGTPTREEGEYIARMVNILTGAGDLGGLKRYAPAANAIMFSPRNFMSRIQMFITEPIKAGTASFAELTGTDNFLRNQLGFDVGSTRFGGPPHIRQGIAREYVKSLMGASLMYFLLLSALDDDAEIESDMTSTMFGAVKLAPNVYLDPLGGIRPLGVLLSRLATGKKTSIKGETQNLYGKDTPYRGDTALSLITQFLRGKMAPAPGVVLSLLDNQTDFKGEPMTLVGTALDLAVPMSPSDIYEVSQQELNDTTMAIAVTMALTGGGVSVVDRQKRPKIKKSRQNSPWKF